MAKKARQYRIVALRIGIASACLGGAWFSWSLARAESFFQQPNEQSLRSAIQLEPDASDYYIRLAQIDNSQAETLLQTALRLNPYNAQAAIQLGLNFEAEGDYPRAEKSLLQAFEVDRTYLPRWSLANFYLRRNNLPAFWSWAHRAAEMPAEDIGSLFELCWRVSPDPEQITKMVANNNPQVLRQYLRFLLEKNQLTAASATAQRLAASGAQEEDRPLLLSVVDQLIETDNATAASAVWRDLIAQHWVVAETSEPNNHDFARDPLPVNLDWTIPSYTGLHSWPGPAGLKTEFTGEEPESCKIAEQTIILSRGSYSMAYAYRTSNIPAGTGIRWQIIEGKAGKTIAESTDLSSESGKDGAITFSVLRDGTILTLRLLYQRPLGVTRISGTLVITSTGIKVNRSV